MVMQPYTCILCNKVHCVKLVCFFRNSYQAFYCFRHFKKDWVCCNTIRQSKVDL